MGSCEAMTIDTVRLVATIRAIAKEFARFGTPPLRDNTFRWDGSKYAPAHEFAKVPWDHYASLNAARLSTVADLIEAQGLPLSSRQIEYLRSTFFGGMGSVSDAFLDPRVLGEKAETANERIQALLRELSAILH
jgi:hypothetical protein